LNDFKNGQYLEILNNLSSNTVGNNGLCGVQLSLSPSMPAIDMKFSHLLGQNPLGDQMFTFITWIQSSSHDPNGFLLINTLQYACCVGGCGKAFIIDHIGWLPIAT
jgi:hypothetical protein